MAEKITLARPYAEAVFRLAVEKGSLDKWSEMLQLAAMVAADARIMAQDSNPRVSREHMAALMLDICGKRLDAGGKNLIRLLVDNHRLEILPEIFTQFEKLKADAENSVEALVTSAFELDSAQMRKMKEALEKKLGRKVELRTAIDDSLVGGVVVRAGDVVIDGTITGRLDELSSYLQ